MALRLASRQARLVVFGYNAVTSRIEWVRSPASPQYAGSPLSLTGGQVMAYYKDGTASDITASCGYDPDDGSLLEYAGELNINASYTDHAGNEFTADTQIDVADMEELLFTSLSHPAQKEGAALDLSGAVLSARYTDGTTRSVAASSVTFEPAAGEMIGHMDSIDVQAVWRNPATGSEYTAQYKVTIDQVEGIYFSHAPNKTHYAGGEPLDLTGATVAMKYKLSGDIMMVTPSCTFYPPDGEIMTPYGTSIHATYQTVAGEQYEAETLVNVQAMTIPIDVIGQIIGEADVSRDCRLAVPLLMIQVSPADPQQLPQLMQALTQLSEEDPLLDFEFDQETREMVIRITGIIQLQILQELLATRYDLEAKFSQPGIIYREQPSRTGRGFEEYTMPKPCWAVVELTVEPLPPGSGLQFRSAIKDNVLAYRYQHHVEQSMRQTFRQGVLGWQVDDALVTLVNGESHHEHTHPLDFFVATPIAALRALTDSRPILLEPWLRMQLKADSSLIDKVIGQIIAMRGEFSSPSIQGSDFTMECFVPLATSLEWPITFQSLTSGKGRLSSAFHEYRPCPPGEGVIRSRRGVDPLDKPKWILHCRGAI